MGRQRGHASAYCERGRRRKYKDSDRVLALQALAIVVFKCGRSVFCAVRSVLDKRERRRVERGRSLEKLDSERHTQVSTQHHPFSQAE